MMDYDTYMAKFDSDPEDDDDPDIKQLKYNALFAEEDGFIIVLPGFKPYRYQIKPVPQPIQLPEHSRHDPGLGHHDQIVASMKEMALTMSGNNCGSSEAQSQASQNPRRYGRRQQRVRASETLKYTEPPTPQQQETFEKRNTHEYDDYSRKTKGNNYMKNSGRNIPRKENTRDVPNGRKDI